MLPFPPPYAGMVAVNSDVECTTWRAQVDILRLFAEHGIETAGSFWLFGDPRLGWRMFDADDCWTPEAAGALHLVRAGLLDTLHSFGDRPLYGTRIDRDRIATALRRMAGKGAVVPVYTNHGSDQDVQNVGGGWATYQQGDVPGSDVYHLDLTLAYGCRYFWTDVDYRNDRWSFHVADDDADALLVAQTARDGNRMLRFRRYRGPLSPAPTAASFAEQMEPVLGSPPEGYLVVYQHLGCHRDPTGKPVPATPPYLDGPGREALAGLAALQRDGRCLFTTTARLLDHAAFMRARPWTVVDRGERVEVTIATTMDIDGVTLPVTGGLLDGWTLRLTRPVPVSVVHGAAEHELAPTRLGGGWAAGFPWRLLPTGRAVEEADALVA